MKGDVKMDIKADTDIAWLAGLLEGEGCFRHTASTPIIHLSMTDRDVVARAAAIMDAKLYGPYSRGNGHQDTWMSSLAGERALVVMRAILPMMGNRRTDRIQSVLAWSSQRPGKRWGENHYASRLTPQIVILIRNLFRRGVSAKTIADMVGVTATAIRDCARGHTWASIPY